MRTLFICGLLLLWMRNVKGETCQDLKEAEDECNETEYETYVDCIRKRVKRSSCGGVENSCKECDCNYCSSSDDCSNNCNACCANFNQPCTTNYCCYRSCHAQCPNNHCRKSCRQTCTHKINGGGGGAGGGGGSETVIVEGGLQSNNTLLHNITTVINLHNVINNTNLIDMPVNVNNTNINNITVEAMEPNLGPDQNNLIQLSPQTTLPTPDGKPQKDKCCHVISPRQCVPNNVYPFMKCFHYRKQVCNNICKAPIMHAQPHQICDEGVSGPPNCHQQIIYIPQPQPRCTYKSTWPYVTCGIQQANCEGCYSHYGFSSMQPGSNCYGCYDQGYDVGPYYRQGPFYRPSFSHVAPCMQTGTCEGGPDFNGWQPMAGGAPMDGSPMGGSPMGDFGFGVGPGVPVGIPLGNAAGYSPDVYDKSFSYELDPSTLPGSPGLPVMNDENAPSKFTFNTSDDKKNDLIVTDTLTLPNQPTPQLEIVHPLVKINTIKHTNDDDVTMTIKESMEKRNIEDVEIVNEPTIF